MVYTKYIFGLISVISIVGTLTYLKLQREEVLRLKVEVRGANTKLQDSFDVSLQEYKTVEESTKLEYITSIPSVDSINSNCTDCNLTFNINSKGVTIEEN